MKSKNFLTILLISSLLSCGGGGGDSSTIDDNVTINPFINFFRVDKNNITNGEFVTLSWQSTNAISCSANGDWSGTKNVTGNQSIQLNEEKTFNFSLVCTGRLDKSSPRRDCNCYTS